MPPRRDVDPPEIPGLHPDDVDRLCRWILGQVFDAIPIASSADLAVVTREIVDKTKRAVKIPELQPGKITAIDDLGRATVALDIDQGLTTVRAKPLVSGLAVDQRVMVLFQPPRAVLVRDVIQT